MNNYKTIDIIPYIQDKRKLKIKKKIKFLRNEIDYVKEIMDRKISDLNKILIKDDITKEDMKNVNNLTLFNIY